MIAFIDVNIWVYYANCDSPFHQKVSVHLEPFLAQERPFAISWQIFYEFIRVVTDPRLYAEPSSWADAYRVILEIFSLSNATILGEGSGHAEALHHVMQESGYTRGHFIHDCHIAALLYEHGIRQIFSADGDFHRFPFLEIIDPTR